ncbi:hypothetical protein GCM10023257_56590 [Streptomyces hyderabadensis]|uniref:Uncharacterized protein n=1 Tax=Streptomyces hyderabadensis TaxID=598549 RepID=A0ABP9IPZ7_9ACTN
MRSRGPCAVGAVKESVADMGLLVGNRCSGNVCAMTSGRQLVSNCYRRVAPVSGTSESVWTPLDESAGMEG